MVSRQNGKYTWTPTRHYIIVLNWVSSLDSRIGPSGQEQRNSQGPGAGSVIDLG